MRAEAKLIARLLAVFGEPRSENPDLFVQEFEKAISGYDADVIARAGDEIIATTRPNDRGWISWPVPGAVRKIADRLTAEKYRPTYQSEPELPPPTPEQVERAKVLAESLKRFVAAHTVPSPAVASPADVSRPAFRAMQEASRNDHLHDRPIGRRMIGGNT